MELKHFVSETITQIVDGVHEAFKNVNNKDVIINPYCKPDGLIDSVRGNGRPVQQIEMNVILKIEGKEDNEDSFKIKVFNVLEYKNGDLSGSLRSQVNSIKFSVPIALPSLYPTGE